MSPPRTAEFSGPERPPGPVPPVQRDARAERVTRTAVSDGGVRLVGCQRVLAAPLTVEQGGEDARGGGGLLGPGAQARILALACWYSASLRTPFSFSSASLASSSALLPPPPGPAVFWK